MKSSLRPGSILWSVNCVFWKGLWGVVTTDSVPGMYCPGDTESSLGVITVEQD